uniref:Chitin-binding type-2 domain-containing protein n=1 Tax=Anopheles minimus TaxID=112268 RepID=A0A182W0S7_9DIPT
MDFVFRVFFLQFLIFGLLVSHVRPQTGGTDCHGKDYLCLDDVRFQLCVDYGDGKPTTVTDEVQVCPQGTFCSNSGHFECDSFTPPSTTAEPHVNVDESATAQPENEENATDAPAVPEETDAPENNPATEGTNDDSTPANPEGSLEPVEEEGTTVVDASEPESSTATVEAEANEVPEEEAAVPSEGTELPEQSETTVPSETVPEQPTEESAPSTSVPEEETVETSSQSTNPETEETPAETAAPVEPEVTNSPAPQESTTVAQETETASVATDAPEVEVSEQTESVVTTEPESETVEQSSTDASEVVTTEESLPSEQSTESVTSESEVSQDSSTVAASEAPEQEETEVPADDNSVAPETTAVPEAGEQEGSEVQPTEPSAVPEVSESTAEPSDEPEVSESTGTSSEPTTESETADTTLAPEAPESSSVSSEPSETTASVTESESTSTASSAPSDEDSSSSNTGESGSNEGSTSQDSTEAPSAESGAESNEGNAAVPQAPGSGPFVCSAAGRFADPTDCHKYYVCFWLPFGLYSIEQNCLTGYAYNPTLERCTADQSVCFPGQFTCMGPGRFPDATDPTQYFWCVWNMFGGYLQYKMQCPMGQVFNPFRGRCAFVVAGTRSLPLDELEDGELVAAEESTTTDSVVVEPTQPAEPVAPVEDQPKLKVKFQCLEEGTFADPNNCSRYFVCTLKKLDKFKKSKFKCATGERFDPLMGVCVPDVDALCE